MIISANLHAKPPKSFTAAKKITKQLFQKQRETLYCGCKYDKQGKIDLKSCNMESAASNQRAHRLEIEHMMPMEAITKKFQCGRTKACVKKNGKHYGGRECCRKISPEYRKIEAELYNLYPAVGSANQARGSYRFGEFYPESKETKYNHFGCPIIVDRVSRSVEPRDLVKGIVARANLFMADKYDLKLSATQKKLLEIWNEKYPPNEREIAWAREIAEIEGYENSYIMKHSSVISDSIATHS